jgi:hypothetical protein
MLIYLTLLKSPLPLETMSQFAESVIPDERRLAGRDPESSEGQFNQIFPGSRLGRDDEV